MAATTADGMTQVMATLKNVSQKIHSSQLKIRNEIFKDLNDVLSSNSDLPEPVLRGLCKLIGSTLHRYKDSYSRSLVNNFIVSLLKYNNAVAAKNISVIISEIALSFKEVTPSLYAAQNALTVLTWSCIVIDNILHQKENVDNDLINNLIQSQIVLVSGSLSAERKDLQKKAFSRLQHVWRNGSAIPLYSKVVEQSKDQATYHHVLFVVFYMSYLNKAKNTQAITDLKPSCIEIFLKSMVTGKGVKPLPFVLNQLKPLLRHLTHDDFKQSILPAMQRAMLRSPETILPCVSAVVQHLSIDLSQYAAELGKAFTSQLHSNNEECRNIAADACSHLAKQCSDPKTMSDLVKYMFGVLNGAEGKLTVVTQRIGIIKGIGRLSENAVTGASSMQEISALVAEQYAAILKQEVHEDTLICVLTNLSLWCLKLTSEIPKALIEIFKTGPSLKSSTSAIRNSYIQCMNCAFHGNTIQEVTQVVPLLIKSVEKAFSQSNLFNIVLEGLSAACLLLKAHRADVQLDKQFGATLSSLLDIKKSPFYVEKFIHQLAEDGLISLATFTERLLIDHVMNVKGDKSCIYMAVLYLMTRPSVDVRKHTKAFINKTLTTADNLELPKEIVSNFNLFLQSHQIVFPNTYENDKEENGETSSNLLRADLAVDMLNFISTKINSKTVNSPDELYEFALNCLEAACNPVVETVQSDTWAKMLANMQIDTKAFIKSKANKLTETILSQKSPILENCLENAVRLVPQEILPGFISMALDILQSSDLKGVTKTDFGIFMTPEGQLYDRSCIESNKEEVQTKNIKRESKLYSYKEQMADIALRKELEEKKKAKGAKTEPQLSKKQQELMKAQVEKENAVRSKMQQLDEKLSQAISILSSCQKGSSEHFSEYMSLILPAIISNMSSPLCATKLSQLYVDIRTSVFNSQFNYQGLSVAYVTLRLKNPACELNEAWVQEDLNKAVSRVITLLHEQSCPKSESMEFEEDKSQLMNAPAFSYCFPLLKEILRRNCAQFENDTVKALQIIDCHSQMRKSHNRLQDPQLLPHTQIFESLISILSESSGQIQVLSSTAVDNVAICVSGEETCARANHEQLMLLLDSLLYSSAAVRESVLASLLHMIDILKSTKEDKSFTLYLTRRIYISKFDVVQENKDLAEQIWDETGLKLSKELGEHILEDACHMVESIRQSSASAMADFAQKYPALIKKMLQCLLDIYHSKLEMPAPILDNFGRMISEPPVDPWEPRSGVALTICKMASSFTVNNVQDLLSFFVPEGLGDRHDEVRREMLNAAVAVIDVHGKDQVAHLLPVFEDFLDKAPNTSTYDTVRQSVVILMGSLARHLEKSDPKVKPIIYKLIDALSTPSQQVQEAVSNCLPPLIPAVKDEAPAIVQKLLTLLLESDNYGERKGAAYGIAGLVKGLGILALKQLEIMNSLTTAIQNKKNHKHREGALFAFEMLCNMLGRLFEPYIVHVLPHLLLCFGDGNQYVREATDDTAKAVMSKLSAHGVKLVLPSLLTALEEDSWRTKTGSVELLGAMAFCAPKQLSSCLPNIVPKLIEVLSDSHIKVQKAGAQALKMIGSVIRNPEIQAIVHVLLEALQDPSKKTAVCLGTLLNTKFVHFIDAPSLALIMPVVQRAFQDRSTETRKMAAQIIGNMYSLTDQKDLGPYLPSITPGLQQSLLDPVPEVRSVSARALGAMVKGMGESCFENLMPWLMQTLTSERSSVDRSGAAQGLSEVIGGLGVDKLHKLMPEIIGTSERLDIFAHVKDGYMMLFIYLPVVFPKEFTQYIGKIINPILQALADENEYVRDTALRAGQRIVNMYADSAITLLLPQLEAGLFDENWRIRYSSVQLLGDLLYKISGVSGKMTTETAGEDDNFGTEQSQKIILRILGDERRNRVLAGLYMGRSDTALMVRQASLHVWKIIVSNTPRTLREILPTLFSLLLGCLASTSYDKRQVAARTLGDLVRKLGERVLPEIIPILEKGLESDQPDQRQGVCIGLSEIMASTSREMVLTFVDSLVPTVRKALCDPLPEVRQAAAKTFDSLHSTVGSRALDDILPQLLEQLGDRDLAECTLDGLKNVMAIKSKVVLPYLVPQLTAEPVNTKALSFLSAVADDALNKHLPKILPALLSALSSAIDTPAEQQEKEYCERVILSVQDDVGVRTIMDELMEATRSKSSNIRRAAVSLLFAFCCQTRADYTQYVSQLIRGLIHLFTDEDAEVLKLSWEALSAVIKTMDAAEQPQHVSTVRQAVRFAVGDAKDALLPGFCLAKGITPILPIFREAILNGPPELKEQAATGLGEVIKITSAEALQPSVVHITGPLIRILGDRFSWNVKASVLDTLALLLAKVGVKLKPFLPQLQTTFLKALNDPHRTVRLKAASALSHLIVIHTRVDQLFTDLTNTVKTTEDSSTRETMLQALRGIISPAGSKISDAVRKQVVQTVLAMISHHEDVTRTCAAGCLGAICASLPDDQLSSVVQDNFLDDDVSLDWTVRHGRSVALFVALKEAPNKVLTNQWKDSISKCTLSYITSDRIPIVQSGIRCLAYFVQHSIASNNPNINMNIWTTFVKLMNHSSNEVKQLLAQAVNHLAKSSEKPLAAQLMKPVIPQLVNGTKEKNTVVKANSEYALVSLLKLRQGDSHLQSCLGILDSGAKESLNDVISKVLRKVASQPEPKDDSIDDTLLT